jgi:hypothetical protein
MPISSLIAHPHLSSLINTIPLPRLFEHDLRCGMYGFSEEKRKSFKVEEKLLAGNLTHFIPTALTTASIGR